MAFLGIVGFGLAAGPGDIIDVGTQVARRSTFGRGGLLLSESQFEAQELEQGIYDVVLDELLEILEHAEGFVFELDKWVALPV